MSLLIPIVISNIFTESEITTPLQAPKISSSHHVLLHQQKHPSENRKRIQTLYIQTYHRQTSPNISPFDAQYKTPQPSRRPRDRSVQVRADEDPAPSTYTAWE
ncbi:MAG: hypothetical protein Q9205_006232 [Flavoplaca limonia]